MLDIKELNITELKQLIKDCEYEIELQEDAMSD
jgi:hypothetical protein